MNKILLLTVFCCLLALGVPAGGAPEDEDLKEAIDYLVEFVRASDVVFIRNAKEHTPEDAASHMLKKYKYAKRKVKTPEDFIEYCATKSTMSGKHYQVRLAGGRTIASSEWLLAALDAYRTGGAGGAVTGDIPYEMREFKKQYGSCPTREEDCASVVISYPEFLSKESGNLFEPVDEEIRGRLLASVYEGTEPADYDQLADSFIEVYKQTQKDFPEYEFGWTLDREASVVFAASPVLCIAIREMSFTGGAHPNSRQTFVNFDVSKGVRMGLGDILKEGYEGKLTAVAEARFREARGIEEGESLSEAGFRFDGDAFSLNDNFGITKEGLVFYFNDYEIGPHALGPTEFTIPYNAISSLIDGEGLLKGAGE